MDVKRSWDLNPEKQRYKPFAVPAFHLPCPSSSEPVFLPASGCSFPVHQFSWRAPSSPQGSKRGEAGRWQPELGRQHSWQRNCPRHQRASSTGASIHRLPKKKRTSVANKLCSFTSQMLFDQNAHKNHPGGQGLIETTSLIAYSYYFSSQGAWPASICFYRQKVEIPANSIISWQKN